MSAVHQHGTGPAHARAKAILDEVSGVAAQYGLNSRDRTFLSDLVARRHVFLSEKQRRWMEALEHKVFVRGVVR